jgi:hypothetical protein
MPAFRSILMGVPGMVAAALFVGPVLAFDLNGAWSIDLSACGKVFKKRGNQLVVTSVSDLYGGGFIIEGNRVRGKFVNCNIESKKQDGTVIHLNVACTDEVATEQLQFDLNVVNNNTVSKTFPETTISVDYYRCIL